MQIENSIICNWCGQVTNIIWVHGHGQCRICGTNIDECCRGENECDGRTGEQSPAQKSQ